MKVLRVLLVVLLCLFLAAVMLVTVGDYTIRATFLNADFIKDRLSAEIYGDSGDENVYEIAAETVQESAMDAFEGEAEEEEWEADVFMDTLEEVLEDADIDEWLRTQVEGILEKVDEDTGEKDGVYPYIKKEVDDLELVISLEELKGDFEISLRENMWEEFDTLLAEDDLPEGLAELAEAQARTEFDQALEETIDQVDQDIPDEVDISPDQQALDDIDPLRSMVTSVNNLFMPLCVLAVFLMVLIAVAILLPFNKLLNRAKTILLALGIVFLLTGIICVIVALIGGNLIPKTIPVDDMSDGLKELVDDMGEDVSGDALTDAIDEVVNEDTVADFFKHLFSPARVAGTILLIIGLAMLVAWLVWFLATRGGEEEVPPEELPVAAAAAAGEGAPAGLTEEPFGEWTEEDEKLAESTDEMAQAEVSSGEEPAGLTEESAEEPSAEPSEDSDEDSLSELMDESPEESSEQ